VAVLEGGEQEGGELEGGEVEPEMEGGEVEGGEPEGAQPEQQAPRPDHNSGPEDLGGLENFFDQDWHDSNERRDTAHAQYLKYVYGGAHTRDRKILGHQVKGKREGEAEEWAQFNAMKPEELEQLPDGQRERYQKLKGKLKRNKPFYGINKLRAKGRDKRDEKQQRHSSAYTSYKEGVVGGKKAFDEMSPEEQYVWLKKRRLNEKMYEGGDKVKKRGYEASPFHRLVGKSLDALVTKPRNINTRRRRDVERLDNWKKKIGQRHETSKEISGVHYQRTLDDRMWNTEKRARKKMHDKDGNFVKQKSLEKLKKKYGSRGLR
jgi:hypothetical protein